MKQLLYLFYRFVSKPLLQVYLKSDSRIRFDGFKLVVYKGVFHPKLFFSTKYFFSFLKAQHFTNRKVLELGSGSGILSMLAYSKNNHVTALDIDDVAVKNTLANFETNFKDLSRVQVLKSNLFEQLPIQCFDVIIINPPYYFKQVSIREHYSWYCGENGEYFEALFSQLHVYINTSSLIYMILEEHCEIARIQNMAAQYHIHFELLHEKLIRFERSFIFKLTLQGN